MKRFILVLSLLLGINFVNAVTPEDLSKQATAFYSDNNFQKTMDLLLQINEKDRSAQDWLLLGNLFEEKGEKENAIFMYQKALFANEKYSKAYYNLANLYLKEEQYTFAIENYKNAIKYNKNNPFMYYNLGCAYLKTGEIKKAKTTFINAVTLNYNIPEFHYNLAYVYKSLNKPKIAQTYLDNYNKLVNNLE